MRNGWNDGGVDGYRCSESIVVWEMDTKGGGEAQGGEGGTRKEGDECGVRAVKSVNPTAHPSQGGGSATQRYTSTVGKSSNPIT